MSRHRPGPRAMSPDRLPPGRPDLTVIDDPVLADCVAALTVIRNDFSQASRAVEARYRRFAADCEHLARRCEEGAT